MKLKIVFCVLLSLMTKESLAQQALKEFLPNPQFILTYDELKFQKTMQEIGLPSNIMQLKSEEMLKYKDKLGKINQVDYFQLAGWQNYSDADKTTFAKAKANDAYWFFNIAENPEDGVFSTLKQYFQISRSYEIRIRYRYLAETDGKNIPRMPSIGVFFSKDLSFKPNSLYKVGELFCTRSTKAEETRRRMIIQEFQKNYGGIYPDDFAQGEKTPDWKEIRFRWKAKGDERFLLIHYETGSYQKGFIPEILFCDLDEVSVQPYDRPGVRESEVQDEDK